MENSKDKNETQKICEDETTPTKETESSNVSEDYATTPDTTHRVLSKEDTTLDTTPDTINTTQEVANSDDDDDEDDEKQLAELLKQHKVLEEEAEKQFKFEMEQRIENAKNNLGIFSQWMEDKVDKKDLYKLFNEQLSAQYRTELFENMCEFFSDQSFVTDDILFHWKNIVVCLLRMSKKYKYQISDLVFELSNKKTNLRLVKEKYIFRCFIDDTHLCYFKENGNDYYVS